MSEDKFPAMLSHKFNVKKIKDWPVAVEHKLDGVRALVILKHVDDEYEISTYSRAGKPFNSINDIEDAICDAFAETGWDEDMVFDGEIFCGDFKTTVSQVKRKSEQAKDAVFTIFDMIPLSEFTVEGTSLEFEDRRKKLYEFFQAKTPTEKKIRLSTAVLAKDFDEIMALYEEARANDTEGVVVKQIRGDVSRWVGKRSWGWMKIKDKLTADCPIIDAEEGQGKFVGTLGNLVISHKGVGVGVGTGITDEERHKLWRLHKKGKLKGLTAQVTYHEETPDGSLRHPVFECIRIDK